MFTPAVEVDGEVGDARHRAGEVDEARLDAAGAAAEHAPRDAEVAVEPGREEHAAVHLDADLLEAAPGQVRVRLDPQVGRVGVGADHAEAARPPGGSAPVTNAMSVEPPRIR